MDFHTFYCISCAVCVALGYITGALFGSLGML